MITKRKCTCSLIQLKNICFSFVNEQNVETKNIFPEKKKRNNIL